MQRIADAVSIEAVLLFGALISLWAFVYSSITRDEVHYDLKIGPVRLTVSFDSSSDES